MERRKAAEAGVRLGDVVAATAKIAFANVADFVECDEDGRIKVNEKGQLQLRSDLTREDLEAISTITVNDRGRVSWNFDRGPALKALRELLHPTKSKVELTGANVTFRNFIAMAAATVGVIYFVDIKNFAGFLAMFLTLFVTTGIGNGSTYRMIPAIFREERLREAREQDESGRAGALKAASIEAAAALGFIGGVGACGGYLIPRGFGASIAMTGGPHLALATFLLFYVTCIALTWWYYLRKTSSLAKARV